MPKLNVTEILTKRQATRAQRAVPMFQCCWCDRLFSTQKAVKTHISNLTKIDKGVLPLFNGKSAAGRPGARHTGATRIQPWRPGVLEGKTAIFIKDSQSKGQCLGI